MSDNTTHSRTATPPQLSIAKEAIATMPVVKFGGRIVLIENDRDAIPAVQYLSSHKAIGFDTETRPSFRKGEIHNVALIQLSTPDTCFLFRINKFGLTQCLKELFENPSVIKVGLSTKDDFHGLGRLMPLEPRNIIELQHYIRKWGITDLSLQKIYAILRQGHITKGQRLTNWEASTLTPAQQQYAAIDAWACLDIYNLLASGQFNPMESPFLTTTATN